MSRPHRVEHATKRPLGAETALDAKARLVWESEHRTGVPTEEQLRATKARVMSRLGGKIRTIL